MVVEDRMKRPICRLIPEILKDDRKPPENRKKENLLYPLWNDDSLLPIPKIIKTTESSCFLDNKDDKNLPNIKDEKASKFPFQNGDRKASIPEIISLTLDNKRRQEASSFWNNERRQKAYYFLAGINGNRKPNILWPNKQQNASSKII